jgi:hypothetical protein
VSDVPSIPDIHVTTSGQPTELLPAVEWVPVDALTRSDQTDSTTEAGRLAVAQGLGRDRSSTENVRVVVLSPRRDIARDAVAGVGRHGCVVSGRT